MSDLDLDALEATARAATPGPWVLDNSGWSKPYDIPDRIAGGVTDDDWTNVIMPQDEQGGGSWSRDEDAEHIATFDPTTTLSLIAEVRRLREAEAVIEKVREIVEPPKPFELGKSMMRSFDRMIGDLRSALATYKPTNQENGEET